MLVHSVFGQDDGVERKVNIRLIYSDTLNIQIYINIDSENFDILKSKKIESFINDVKYMAPCFFKDIELTSIIANRIIKETDKLKEFYVKIYIRSTDLTLEKIKVNLVHNLIDIYYYDDGKDERYQLLIKIEKYGKMKIVKLNYKSKEIEYVRHKDKESIDTNVLESNLSKEEENAIIKEKNKFANQLFVRFKNIVNIERN